MIPYLDHVRSYLSKDTATQMKRRFRWPSRKEARAADPPPQHITAPLSERPAVRSQPLPSSIIDVNHSVNTSIKPNVRHSTAQDGTSSGANATKKDYWHLAVEELQKEDLSVAEQITGVQRAAAVAGNADFADQLLHTIQQG